jgi:hypothetical protein
VGISSVNEGALAAAADRTACFMRMLFAHYYPVQHEQCQCAQFMQCYDIQRFRWCARDVSGFENGDPAERYLLYDELSDATPTGTTLSPV